MVKRMGERHASLVALGYTRFATRDALIKVETDQVQETDAQIISQEMQPTIRPGRFISEFQRRAIDYLDLEHVS